MKPQELKPKTQSDWQGFCKGGALLSTKWTIVRVAYHETPRTQAEGAERWKYKALHDGKIAEKFRAVRKEHHHVGCIAEY